MQNYKSYKLTNNLRNTGSLFAVLAVLSLVTPNAHAQDNALMRASDFSYAEKLALDGYVDLAIGQYKEFLARFPNDARAAEATRRIADGYLSLNMYSQARTFYEKLTLQHGTSSFAADAIYKIGLCFEGEGELIAAAQQFERFALLNASLPLAADAYLRAGRLYLRAGERIHGRKLLYQLIENFPDNQEALAAANATLIGDFVDAGEYNRAFSSTNAYLQRFAQHTATPDIWLIKAGLYLQLGQISEAITTLEDLRTRYPKSDAAMLAGLQLADLYFKMGDRSKALQLVNDLSKAERSDSVQVEAALLRAQILLEETKPAEAASKLHEAMASFKPTLSQRIQAGRLFMVAEDPQNALEQYELADGMITAEQDSLRAFAALKQAEAAFQLGNGAKALQSLRAISESQQPASMRPGFKYLYAELYFDLYKDPARASRHYADFVEMYPEHVLVDDAQAKLARCYEALQEWQLAASEWRRLGQNYPASRYYSVAKNHISLLERYFLPDYLSLVESAIENLTVTTIDRNLRQAEIYFRFRQFQKAIPLLKSAIASDENSGIRARAMYLLGNCYYALADIATVDANPRAVAFFDSAKVLLNYVHKQYADQLDSELLDVQLANIALKSENVPIATLDSISREHVQDQRFAELHGKVLQQLLPAIASHDSSTRFYYLQRVSALGAFPNSQWLNQAIFIKVQLALQQQDTSQAITELEILSNSKQSDPVKAEAELLYAKLLSATGRQDVAMTRLNEMRFKYHYSAYADSAYFYLARYAYQKGDFDSAIQYLQSLRARRLSNANEFTTNALSPAAAFLEAEALALAGDHFDAIRSYLNFVQSYPAEKHASSALIALGGLAEQFYANSLAKSYYTDVIKLYPQRQSEVNQAKLKLVDLEFRLGNYQVARTLALAALQSELTFAEEMQMTKMAIIANLRQNDASNTENEIKNFKNKFDDENEAYAEIQFEFGDYYIRQKNFRRADRIFKDLSNKFEGTRFGIQGQFGYGKSQLFQAKTEDALEILTDIPRKYPNHPFLRVVYLNLGDFYLEQQQWGNAIQAFNNVLADSIHDQNHKAALAKMSELYQSTGMSDACMTYTRKYVELFPQEENIMFFQMRIGSLLREMKRYDEAISHYRGLVSMANGENAIEIQYYIGDSYFEAKKYELAIAEFLKLRYTKLNTKLPWRTTAVYKAGEAYMRLNDYNRAREMYDYVVRSEGVNSQLGNFAFRKIAQIDEMLKSVPEDVSKS